MSDHPKYANHLVSREKNIYIYVCVRIYIVLISKCSPGDVKRLVLTYFIDGFGLAVCVLGC